MASQTDSASHLTTFSVKGALQVHVVLPRTFDPHYFNAEEFLGTQMKNFKHVVRAWACS